MKEREDENLQMLADMALWLSTTEKLLEIIIKKTASEAPTTIGDSSSSSASSSPPSSSVTTASEEKETPTINEKKRSFEALTMVEPSSPSSSSSPPSSSVSFASVEEKPPKIPRLVPSLSDRTGLKEQHLGHNSNNKKDKSEDSAPCWWAGVTRKKRTLIIRRKRLIEAPPEPEPKPEPQIDRLAELRERVWAAGGEDLQLAVEKPLTATDVSQSHGRLSMPNRSLKSEFLTEEEASQTKDGNVLRVLLVDERSREFCLRMRQWSMTSNRILNLYGDWNSVAAENCLSVGEVIQLWSFRQGSTLCFALVKGQI